MTKTVENPWSWVKSWDDIQLMELEQDEIWVDVHREAHLLSDMTPGHRRNALRMLKRKAEKLYLNAILRAVADEFFPHRLSSFTANQHEAWLSEQPLIKKLQWYEDTLTLRDKVCIKVEDWKWRRANA